MDETVRNLQRRGQSPFPDWVMQREEKVLLEPHAVGIFTVGNGWIVINGFVFLSSEWVRVWVRDYYGWWSWMDLRVSWITAFKEESGDTAGVVTCKNPPFEEIYTG